MKYVMTIICAIAFAFAGVKIASINKSNSVSYRGQAMYAAPVQKFNLPELPLDVQLDLKSKYSTHDTVYIKSGKDTVFVDRIVKPKRRRMIARAEAKRHGLSIPAPEPDDSVRIICTGREEKPVDTIGPPKESIILVVDGEEVYKR